MEGYTCRPMMKAKFVCSCFVSLEMADVMVITDCWPSRVLDSHCSVPVVPFTVLFTPIYPQTTGNSD